MDTRIPAFQVTRVQDKIYKRHAVLIEHDWAEPEGLSDSRGRDVGFAWRIYECTYTESDGSGFSHQWPFIARTSATRDGSSYGPITADLYASTLDEIRAKVKTRCDKYLKKYGAKQ